MGYHPRIETDEYANLITSRTRDSRLWFANNEQLEERIIGLTAKYTTRHEITLYGFALEGNHIHLVTHITKNNRGDFLRDLKSTIAKSVPKLTPTYLGGGVWDRRFSNEFIADDATLEEYFFYVALQPIKDGLVDKISDYPGYNCFHDAVWGIARRFKIFNGTAYYRAKRYGANVRKADFYEEFTLRYERLPGYEHLSQKEYAILMHEKLEERRQDILRARAAEGKKSSVGRERLKKVVPGSLPKWTKTSTATTHRPRVLSLCHQKRAEMRAWYFGIFFQFKDASSCYRQGNMSAEFPAGTYRPYSKPIVDTVTVQ
jgi:REP element-mobilizing transposase RayT